MSIFGALGELRHRPIGDQAASRAARIDCRQRVPIRRDNALFGEAMAQAGDFGLKGVNFYATPNNPPYWLRVEGATEKLLLRRSLGEKLARVNARAGTAEGGAARARQRGQRGTAAEALLLQPAQAGEQRGEFLGSVHEPC